VWADLLGANGRITFLRVNDVGTGYGPPNDYCDCEVILKLDTQPGKAFGFQLRNDNASPARWAMYDLLRDAFNSNQPVWIEYNIDPGKNHGIITRVYVTK
jgi:hypothetical protein